MKIHYKYQRETKGRKREKLPLLLSFYFYFIPLLELGLSFTNTRRSSILIKDCNFNFFVNEFITKQFYCLEYEVV